MYNNKEVCYQHSCNIPNFALCVPLSLLVLVRNLSFIFPGSATAHVLPPLVELSSVDLLDSVLIHIMFQDICVHNVSTTQVDTGTIHVC